MSDPSARIPRVTGAGRGVGAGIARMFAAQGARVAVNDINIDRAQETVKDITAAGGLAVAAPFDVCDYEAVRFGIERLEAELGSLDTLVNNAGVPSGMTTVPFASSQPHQWRPGIDLNLYGVMNCCHVVLHGMVMRRFGRVITISSGAGTTGLSIGVSPYAAGKGGAISFMRHFALENAGVGITANTIAVGMIESAAGPTLNLPAIPTGRRGTPGDVAALCVYLASNEASWITAQTLQLNGGSITT